MRNEPTVFRPRTIALLLASALALPLSACQPPAPDEQEAVAAQAQQAAQAAAAPAAAPEAPPAGSCDASLAQTLVGQPLTEDAARQARQDTHAQRVRVLKPGQVVTLEFDGERLNIDVDAGNVVSGVRCG